MQSLETKQSLPRIRLCAGYHGILKVHQALSAGRLAAGALDMPLLGSDNEDHRRIGTEPVRVTTSIKAACHLDHIHDTSISKNIVTIKAAGTDSFLESWMRLLAPSSPAPRISSTICDPAGTAISTSHQSMKAPVRRASGKGNSQGGACRSDSPSSPPSPLLASFPRNEAKEGEEGRSQRRPRRGATAAVSIVSQI